MPHSRVAGRLLHAGRVRRHYPSPPHAAADLAVPSCGACALAPRHDLNDCDDARRNAITHQHLPSLRLACFGITAQRAYLGGTIRFPSRHTREARERTAADASKLRRRGHGLRIYVHVYCDRRRGYGQRAAEEEAEGGVDARGRGRSMTMMFCSYDVVWYPFC